MKNLFHTVRDKIAELVPGNQGGRRLRVLALVQVIWGIQCIDGGQNVLFQTQERIANVHCYCHRVTTWEDIKVATELGIIRKEKPWRRNESPLPKGVEPSRQLHMREHGWSELTLDGPLKLLFEQTQAEARAVEESQTQRQQTLRSPKQRFAIQKAIEEREAGKPRYSAPPVRTVAQPKPFSASEPLQPIQAPPPVAFEAITSGLTWDNEARPKPKPS